jgi:hypothetical protein
MLALPGYSAEDVKSGGTSTKPSRALEDGAVKSGGNTNKPARAVDSEKKASKKKKKTTAPAPKPAQ